MDRRITDHDIAATSSQIDDGSESRLTPTHGFSFSFSLKMRPEPNSISCEIDKKYKVMYNPLLLHAPNLSSEFTDKYNIEFIIGWGGFGTVAKVKNKEGDALSLACKFIPKAKVSQVNMDPDSTVPREVAVLKNVSPFRIIV